MRERRLSRRGWPRIAMVLAVSVASLVGIQALVALGDPSEKPAGPTYPEDRSVPPPGEPDGESVRAVPAPFTVPVASDAPRGVACPNEWTWFDNPVMHYGLCVPPGWGFSDLTVEDPATELPSAQLTNLHLLSANAFPWQPGAALFDAVEEREVVAIELTLLEADAASVTECEPRTPESVGGRTFLTCRQPYDVFGLPAKAGPTEATKVIVPLDRTPIRMHPLAEPTGARLLAVVRQSTDLRGKEANLAWHVIQSIRPS